MSTKKAKSDFEFALEVALPSGETDRLFAHESALQQRIAELEKQYEARGLVVKCQRARIDELEFAIGNPSLLARVDSKQRLAEMVDNEFKLAERIAELEERNERLTRENGSTLLALSKAERELAAEKYEHLHSINQRDGLYVQLEAFKAKVMGSKVFVALHKFGIVQSASFLSEGSEDCPYDLLALSCECTGEQIRKEGFEKIRVFAVPVSDIEPEVQAHGEEYPHDYVQFDMGGRYLLIPFPLLEIWYQTAVKARRHIKGLDPEPTK